MTLLFRFPPDLLVPVLPADCSGVLEPIAVAMHMVPLMRFRNNEQKSTFCRLEFETTNLWINMDKSTWTVNHSESSIRIVKLPTRIN